VNIVVHYPKNEEGASESKDDAVAEAKSPQTPKKKRHSNAGQMSFRDASLQMLQDAGSPLSASELAKRVIDQGLVVTTGKTPDRTIAAMIYNEIRHKPSCPFKLISPGVFGLKEFGGSAKSSDAADQSDNAELEDDTNDEDYHSPGKKTPRRNTPRKSTPKKSTPKKATPTKRKTPSKTATPKKKRKVTHKDDTKDEGKEEEEEEDIDNDLLSAIKGKDNEEKTDVVKKGEPSARTPAPMGKKQRILDKLKHDNETPKVEETEDKKDEKSVYVPPPRANGYKQESMTYGYKYLKYFLDLSARLRESNETSDNDCFICKNGGELVCCDYPKCLKGYHRECVELETVPKGKWFCPRHYCIECLKESRKLEAPNATTECSTCPTSYCEEHMPSSGYTESTLDKTQIICQDCLPHFNQLDEGDDDEDEKDEKEEKEEKEEQVEKKEEKKEEVEAK
jgi:hypothetical protein